MTETMIRRLEETNRYLVELEVARQGKKQPQRLQYLIGNPLAQKYFSQQEKIEGVRTIAAQLNDLFSSLTQPQEAEIVAIEQKGNEVIVNEARKLIVAYLSSSTSYTKDTKELEMLKDNEVIKMFFDLPINGSLDLGQIINQQLIKINLNNLDGGFKDLYTLLRAVQIVANEGNLPAISPAPPIETAVAQAETDKPISRELISIVVRGIITYSQVPERERGQVNPIIRTAHPPKITEALESAIKTVRAMSRQEIEAEASQLPKDIRQNQSNTPPGIFDRIELFDRTLRLVQAEIDAWTTPKSSDLPLLEEKFRLALVIMSYYCPAA